MGLLESNSQSSMEDGEITYYMRTGSANSNKDNDRPQPTSNQADATAKPAKEMMAKFLKKKNKKVVERGSGREKTFNNLDPQMEKLENLQEGFITMYNNNI